MGALSGVLSRTQAGDTAVVRRMLAASPHRGAVVHTAALGSAVLAVAGPPDGSDAWIAERDGLAAAFVGVLDNTDELVQLLRDRGSSASTANPAEVFLSLFRLMGDDTPRVLRGAYSAVATDGERLMAFRDHLGFGPLCFRDDGRGLFVASEAKQVVAGAALASEPDLEVLERLFYNLIDDDLGCSLKGIRRLPKASVLHGDLTRPVVIERYWNPERLLETAHLSADDIHLRFDELMDRASARMLTGADVISLSGGVDSNAVVAFAAPAHLRLVGRPLPAVTHVFPDHPSVDELHYTRMVSDHFGLPLHTYTSGVGQLDGLGDWVRLTDGPPLALLPEIAQIQRLVRSLGFRTMLTGEFGEYVYDSRASLLTHLFARRRFAALRRLLRTWPEGRAPTRYVLRHLISALVPSPVAAAYRRFSRRAGNPWLPGWLDSRIASRAFYNRHLTVPPQRVWVESQLAPLHGPSVGTESEEICGALHGVHTRRPIADIDVWEFFLALPAEIKFPDTLSKTLVRSLLRGKIPDPVLDRRDKTVFDEFAVARIDYAGLRRWLLNPSPPIRGVNYVRLAQRLERRDLSLVESIWANDLAAVHAFLNLWN